MKFILATHNKKKCAEMSRILSPLGVEVYTANMLGISLSDAEETGTTFLENAIIKAQSGLKESGYACIADDSGLCVDALGGEPGVYSARYSGVHGNDEQNIIKLLENLKDVPDEKRTAHFSCCVCVCFPNGKEIHIEGRCDGKIGYEKIGEGGFGYDPVFMVGDKSFAQLSSDEKDKISHRGQALRKLVEVLEQYINQEETV